MDRETGSTTLSLGQLGTLSVLVSAPVYSSGMLLLGDWTDKGRPSLRTASVPNSRNTVAPAKAAKCSSSATPSSRSVYLRFRGCRTRLLQPGRVLRSQFREARKRYVTPHWHRSRHRRELAIRPGLD